MDNDFGTFVSSPVQPGSVPAVFPGSFNPLHSGHQQMARIAAARLACEVRYEISITNVDKPPLDDSQIAERSAQFESSVLLLTRASRFYEKAQLFPGTTFIVGADTLERLIDPSYYGNDATLCENQLQSIIECGCRFLAFGRQFDRRFGAAKWSFEPRLHDLPNVIRSSVSVVSEAEFRTDISSTEIRKRHRSDRHGHP